MRFIFNINKFLTNSPILDWSDKFNRPCVSIYQIFFVSYVNISENTRFIQISQMNHIGDPFDRWRMHQLIWLQDLIKFGIHRKSRGMYLNNTYILNSNLESGSRFREIQCMALPFIVYHNDLFLIFTSFHLEKPQKLNRLEGIRLCWRLWL